MSVSSRRICFVHPDLGLGGAERLVVDAAVGLQNLGHKITILTSHCDSSHCFDEARDGKPISVYTILSHHVPLRSFRMMPGRRTREIEAVTEPSRTNMAIHEADSRVKALSMFEYGATGSFLPR